MPQTSADWAFWAFSTILVGFLLNVVAGLAANPIAKTLASRRSKKTVAVTRSQELFSPLELPSHEPKIFPDRDPNHFGVASFASSSVADDSFLEPVQEDSPSHLSKDIDALIAALILDNESVMASETFESTVKKSTSPTWIRGLMIMTLGMIGLNLNIQVLPTRRSRIAWLLATALLGVSLCVTWLAASFGAPVAILTAALIISAILLVVVVALLVRYIRQQASWGRWP